jgi:predicted CXXCH cytochrome family protein
MRSHPIGLLVLLYALAPAASLAIDAPHDGSAIAGASCETCHTIHNATGGTLVKQADNNTACTVCHNDPATTINQARLGLPWLNEDQAVPGKGGSQHRWDALAENAAFGASRPTDAEMLKRIKDGRIQCAACHDVHADVKARDASPQHVSLTPGAATAPTGGTAGMTMALSAPAAGASTRGYRVQVEAISGAQFRLAISHNARSTDGPAVWWVNNGTAWIQGALGTGTRLWSTGTAVALDDGANVQVTFTGTPAAGQFWDFYVSSAHLRASNVADALCLQCHASRNQSHLTVEGPGNGITVYSHPVGQALNANGKGYDRASGNVLDANGATQTVGDGNTSNDLRLDAGTTVRCTTCHRVHNADSNSLTVDAQ